MKPLQIFDVPQRSPEWFALRAGKVTGSCAKDMLAKIKSGEAAARRDLKYKLIAERLTGTSQEDGYVNAAMQWGIDREADAVAAYEAARRELVTAVGFCAHPTLCVGTSPDGLIAEEGLLSVKCPKTATHLTYLRAGREPSEHTAQNTHELWLTGRPWLDFVSYDPRLPVSWQLFIVRVTRTTAELAAYEAELLKFLAELDVELAALRTMMDLSGVLKETVAALTSQEEAVF